jgi:hypothetical protein
VRLLAFLGFVLLLVAVAPLGAWALDLPAGPSSGGGGDLGFGGIVDLGASGVLGLVAFILRDTAGRMLTATDTAARSLQGAAAELAATRSELGTVAHEIRELRDEIRAGGVT